jgi:nucleoid-associated protein YgaU
VLQLSLPLRQSTTQTLGGIFKDIAGLGIGQINLQGNTGWRGAGGLDGYQIAHNLYDLYKAYPARFIASDSTELLMVDDIDGYSFSITMDNYQMNRDKSAPLLYQYTIPITILQDMSSATPFTPDAVQAAASNISVYTTTATGAATILTTTQKTYYAVQAGDTLSGIAYEYYRDWSKYALIAQANNISAPYTIYTGQQLTIPAG